MVVSVLVLLEKPVGFKALPTSHIVDLECTDMAVGVLLSVKILVSESEVSLSIGLTLE